MADQITMTPINFRELQQAFDATPERTTAFVKQAMLRFARKVRRDTIRDMNGRKAMGPQAKSPSEPLFGGQFKQGGNVKGFTSGTDLASLKAVTKISRILRVHEEGGTITPKQAAYLALSRKTGVVGKGTVLARVKSVTIPPRLHFRKAWDTNLPDATTKVLDATARAMRMAIDDRLNMVGSLASALEA